MSSRVPATVVAVALAGMATGCGTGSDRREVRGVVTAFLRAQRAGSGGEACALLSPALRQQLASGHGSCPQAIRSVRGAGDTVGNVRVFATSAMAQAGDASLFLGLRGRRWRIDAFGCRRTGPGPFDCQAQG